MVHSILTCSLKKSLPPSADIKKFVTVCTLITATTGMDVSYDNAFEKKYHIVTFANTTERSKTKKASHYINLSC